MADTQDLWRALKGCDVRHSRSVIHQFSLFSLFLFLFFGFPDVGWWFTISFLFLVPCQGRECAIVLLCCGEKVWYCVLITALFVKLCILKYKKFFGYSFLLSMVLKFRVCYWLLVTGLGFFYCYGGGLMLMSSGLTLELMAPRLVWERSFGINHSDPAQ